MFKKILRYIALIIFIVLSMAFAYVTYTYYSAIHSDDPIMPSLFVERWSTTIMRGNIIIKMSESESYDLQEKDSIITDSMNDSVSLIRWPDHSTTRLGWWTELLIESMRVNSDYSQIEIHAILKSGKTWSNIVRVVTPGSFVRFTVPKTGIIAWVRWTVFDISVDDNYIRSIDHRVSVTNKDWYQRELESGDSITLSDIRIQSSKKADNDWLHLNMKSDSSYNQLRAQQLRKTYDLLSGKTGTIPWLDRITRQSLSSLEAFGDISIIESLSSGDISEMAGKDSGKLLRWYQAFQWDEFASERGLLRESIIDISGQRIPDNALIDIMKEWAQYDIHSLQDIQGSNLKDDPTILPTIPPLPAWWGLPDAPNTWLDRIDIPSGIYDGIPDQGFNSPF